MALSCTEREEETLAAVLKRLRGVTAANGRTMKVDDILNGLRLEAYKQECAGAMELRDVLDAGHTLILQLLIERQDRQRFQRRG